MPTDSRPIDPRPVDARGRPVLGSYTGRLRNSPPSPELQVEARTFRSTRPEKKKRTDCLDKLIKAARRSRDKYDRLNRIYNRMNEKNMRAPLKSEDHEIFQDLIDWDAYTNIIGHDPQNLYTALEYERSYFSALQKACSFFGVTIRA